MSKATRALVLPILLFLFVAAESRAQDQIQEVVAYELLTDSLTIDGTSNKSDWTVYVKGTTGTLTMLADPSVEDPGVEEVQITVPSKQKSERGVIMNRLMDKALKVQQHPEIVYVLKEVLGVEPSSEAANVFTLQTLGDLTIAGATNEIEMAVEGTLLDDGQVAFAGSHALLMSDYDIQKPTAMFGALVTGDEVVIGFYVRYGLSVTGSE